jgi:rhodanese-related sulfurtransferase
MILIDLRSERLYRQSHLCDAINLPTPLPPLATYDVQNLEIQLRELLYGLPLNYPIGVYCKKGIRANIAVEILKQIGYSNATNLGGFCTQQ